MIYVLFNKYIKEEKKAPWPLQLYVCFCLLTIVCQATLVSQITQSTLNPGPHCSNLSWHFHSNWQSYNQTSAFIRHCNPILNWILITV